MRPTTVRTVLTMSRNVDPAILRARYKALLPKYGELWKSMAPREPLSLLMAIENGQTVSLKIPSSCDCPFDGSCQGCAAPILEFDHDASPLNSTSTSGDTTIGFDLSYIRLDDNTNSPNAAVNQSKSQEHSVPATATFRDALNDDESTVSSENGSKCDYSYQQSASSSGSSIHGYDLSHLHVEDDDESMEADESTPLALVPPNEAAVKYTSSSKKESASSPDLSILESDFPFLRIEEDNESNKERKSSPAALVSTRESPFESNSMMRNVDTSHIIDLLEDTDSEDESITNGDSPMDKASVVEDGLIAKGENRKQIDSKPGASVQYLSDSSEEEWNENMSEGESMTSSQRMKPNRSPTVIVVSDSDDTINETWLQVNEESSDTSDNDSLVDSTFLVDTLDTKPSPKQVKAPGKNKGVSKASFRKRREQRARTVFTDFNRAAFCGALVKVELMWSNKLRTTAGLTRLRRKFDGGGAPERSATIELSTKIIDEEHRLRSTLLHEMCHAAAWLVDGVSRPPHGSCFKKWANVAMQKVPGVIVTTTHSYEVAFKFAWACTAPKCGVIIQRHSRSVDIARHCCGKCKAKLIEIEVPSGKGSNMEQTPKKKKALSGYNLFVKQNSKLVRERLVLERNEGSYGQVTQPDVMKECARLWRELNQNSHE